MKLAHVCREHAFTLREMAEETPELKSQLLCIADKWMTVAVLREQIYGHNLSSHPPTFPASLSRH